MSGSNVMLHGIRERMEALERAARSENAAEVLIPGLEDPALSVRQHAVALAGRYLSAETLLDLVRDGDNATRRNAAVDALKRQIPSCLPALQEACADADADVVIFAMEILGRCRDRDAGSSLLKMVDHPDPNIAAAAIDAVGRSAPPNALETLTRALELGEWQRMAAIGALGELGDPRATGVLLPYLQQPLLRDLTLSALTLLADSSAAPSLLQVLETQQRASTRRLAVLALHQLARRSCDEATQAAAASAANLAKPSELRAWMTDKDPELKAAAAHVAASCSEDLTVEVLRACQPEHPSWPVIMQPLLPRLRAAPTHYLRNADPVVRAQALRMLCGEENAHVWLRERLTDLSVEVRCVACECLERHPHASACADLANLLSTGETAERKAALKALCAMPEQAVPWLERAIEAEKDPHIRARLVSAISRPPEGRLAVLLEQDMLASETDLRRAALSKAALLNTERALNAAESALVEAKPALVGEAAEQLVRAGRLGAIFRCLEQPALQRFPMIAALAKPGLLEAVAPLVAAYQTAQLLEQAEIAGALAAIGGSEACAFLAGLHEHPEVAVRRAAAQAIASAGAGYEAAVLLFSMDDDWMVRRKAVAAMSQDAKRYREPLEILARDTDDMVARAARAALGIRVSP